MPKRVLMIAFHFPPVQGSSGVHRTLAFAKHLPEHGWQASVVTADLQAYTSVREENWDMIPGDLRVVRAFARDTKRHFSLNERYPKWLALPDRWVSWAVGATIKGLQLVRREHPDVVFSTYPIASAHLAGMWISRLTGLPWVADFRDPMAEPGYPPDAQERRVYQWIEACTVNRARRVLVTTPGTKKFYQEAYPRLPRDRLLIVPNGYEEDLERLTTGRGQRIPGKTTVVLLHSGIVYPRQRNPSMLFAALSELKESGEICARDLQVHLRASGHDEELRRSVDACGISDLVCFLPPLGYVEAAKEIAEADALLLLQSDVCNRQIPAKAYEYLLAQRPILGLTDPMGDTGQLLLEMGVETVVALEDKLGIKRELIRFLATITHGTYVLPSIDRVKKLSRRESTRALAHALDSVYEETQSIMGR
jgi:hypothetical protein